jgi:hypothetical protein
LPTPFYQTTALLHRNGERHALPVYVKITRDTGGGFEGLAGKRKFAGPGGKDKAEPLRFEVEDVAKPPER